MSVYSEIKKYLLYLVGFFCVVLSAHIVVLYFYNDAETYPINGGTINVGIMGKMPTMDILTTDTKIDNNTNDTVLHFLYRGLLRYSNSDKKIVGDLAKCGLDTFPTIRCTLGQNALWSDGTSMSTDDVISTFEFFKENTRNESIKNRLSLIDVQEDRGDIVFRFKTTDATTLDTLFLPILNKKDIAHFDTNANLSGKLFSGPYIFDSVDEDKNTLLLKQNQYFKDAEMVQYFDQVRFGFWETMEELEDAIDADIVLSDIAFNKSASAYIRPLVYGIFLNSTRLPNTLRGAIFNDIFSTLDTSIIDEKNFKKEDNIFLGEISTPEKKTIEGMFMRAANALGYSMGGTAPTPPSTPPTPTVAKLTLPEKPLKYITRPGKVSPLFSSAETVEIGGIVPRGTTKVVINGYTLQNFIASRKQFNYNARSDYKNLVEGENTYKVTFMSGKKTLAQETLTLYYGADANTITKIKESLSKSEPQTEPVVIPEPVATIAPTNLDPQKLYKDGKPLSMTVVIQNEISFFPQLAEEIQKKLNSLGVTVQIIALPVAEIKKNLQDPNFSYDIVLSGINLGLFHYNILPFFHSGQVKEGYNVSRLRNASLDSIMERMTEQLYYGSPDKLRNFEANAEKILDQEAVFKTIASPYEYISVKETVLGFTTPEFLPGRESLVEILSKSYFKQGYKLSKEPKTISGFFVWLKNELFSHI